MEGDRYHLDAEEAVARCDENTIGVVAILGSTFDGSYEPVPRSRRPGRAAGAHRLDIPVHVDGASGAMIAPFLDPDLEWDFRLPRVPRSTPPATSTAWSTRASAGSSGATRRAARGPGLQRQLPRRRHADVRAELLPARRQVAAQYYNFLRLGREGYRAVQQTPRTSPLHLAGRDRQARARSSCSPRRRAAGVRVHAARRHYASTSSTCRSGCGSAAGWCPAYTFPENRTDLAVLRIVVRNGFSVTRT
jgi:glutamate decarboxylase